MDLQEMILAKAGAAKEAAQSMNMLSTEVKNAALLAMAHALEQRCEAVLEANQQDLEQARHKGVKRSYLDRLMLDESRLKGMADGL